MHYIYINCLQIGIGHMLPCKQAYELECLRRELNSIQTAAHHPLRSMHQVSLLGPHGCHHSMMLACFQTPARRESSCAAAASSTRRACARFEFIRGIEWRMRSHHAHTLQEQHCTVLCGWVFQQSTSMAMSQAGTKGRDTWP